MTILFFDDHVIMMMITMLLVRIHDVFQQWDWCLRMIFDDDDVGADNVFIGAGFLIVSIFDRLFPVPFVWGCGLGC